MGLVQVVGDLRIVRELTKVFYKESVAFGGSIKVGWDV